MKTEMMPVVPALQLVNIRAYADILDPEDGEWMPSETQGSDTARTWAVARTPLTVAQMFFTQYVDELDAILRDMWCIDTIDAGISADEIDDAIAAGITPAALAQRFGEDNGLLAH